MTNSAKSSGRQDKVLKKEFAGERFSAYFYKKIKLNKAAVR